MQRAWNNSNKTSACEHKPAVLLDYSIHAALWCQRQNQGAFLIFHVYVETAKAWQEHHLSKKNKQIGGQVDQLTWIFSMDKRVAGAYVCLKKT